MIDIREILVGFLAILISLTVHEFAHAWMADRLGDPTPGEAGRLTLNPMVMIRAHPVGALIAPLLGAMSGFLIGWAATPVNYARVRRGVTIRKAALLIAGAGPASNLLLAVAGVVAFAVLSTRPLGDWAAPLVQLSLAMVMCNVLLAVFNMIPIPPLDGFTVFHSVFGNRFEKASRFLAQYSTILFLLVILKGEVIFRPIFNVVYVALDYAQQVALGL